MAGKWVFRKNTLLKRLLLCRSTSSSLDNVREANKNSQIFLSALRFLDLTIQTLWDHNYA